MVLLWTHDGAARDAVCLALSRFGLPFVVVNSPEEVKASLPDPTQRAALVLGPTFTREEAQRLRAMLPDHLAVVLLVDLLDPLPAEVIEAAEPVEERLVVPVRARNLRRVLGGLLAA